MAARNGGKLNALLQKIVVKQFLDGKLIVREPAILFIKWLRPKGLKMCSYVEKYAKFKNQTLKKIGWYTKMLCAAECPRGGQFLKLALKLGTLYHESNLTYLAPPITLKFL